MSEVGDHNCPVCNVRFGVLRTLSSDGRGSEDLIDGAKHNSHSVCVVCGTFLQIVEVKEGRARARTMTDEEILALPDNERIALSRLAKATSKIPPEIMKESIERFEVVKNIFLKVREELLMLVDAEVEKHFGKEVGCILILKDIRPLGFHSIQYNVPEHLVEQTLRRALSEVDGSLNEDIRKALLG